MFLVEFGLLPFAAVEHLPEVLDGVPDVFEADVQRREAEAQDVRVRAAVAGPEVTDHTAGDQRLHDGVGAGSPRQADLRAALRVLARCGERQAVAGTARLHQFDEQVGQASDLARRAAMPPSGSAASRVSSPHSSAAMLMMGWVPHR